MSALLLAQLKRARRELEAAQRKSTKASEARAALPAGSSRARVTTANARWGVAAEARDRAAAEVARLEQMLAAEGGAA